MSKSHCRQGARTLGRLLFASLAFPASASEEVEEETATTVMTQAAT